MVAGLLSFAASASAQEEKFFDVDSWSDYIAPDILQNFGKETGIKVRYDTYDNNEVLYVELEAGKTRYDIVVPSSTFARLQVDGGLLTQLDVAQLLNLKNRDPEIQPQIANTDPGNQHFSNCPSGYTTIGVNAARVNAALGLSLSLTTIGNCFLTLTLRPELTPASKQDFKP